MTLLPCAEIASDWKLLWELQRECSFRGDQVTRTRKIKNDTHWRSGWIPIMDFEGDKVVLDLDPGPGGKCGQVIRWYNYGGRPMCVLAESYAAWLAQIAEELSHRRFTLDEWGGIHLRKRLA
jgi:cell wall assembly regulator SMI1